MKVLVIGCGSIGRRHIRNLLGIKAGSIFAFDTNENKISTLTNDVPSIIVSTDLSALWKEKPEVVFVTNPTAFHINYSLQAARKNCDIFIEKPLSHNRKNIGKLIEIVTAKNIITMVGCNMRFHWAIKEIKKLIDKKAVGKIISARIETGQYLPDWHPWEDYRQMYSSKKNLGGGIILDAIHEIDYAMWMFGDVEKTTSIFGKLSSLEIDTEDIAEIILKFKNGPIVNIHMDYIQRQYSRSFKIIGDEGTIFWDINNQSVNLYDANVGKWNYIRQPDEYDTNQMYVEEIEHFIDCVRKRKKTINDIRDSLNVLDVAFMSKRSHLAK